MSACFSRPIFPSILSLKRIVCTLCIQDVDTNMDVDTSVLRLGSKATIDICPTKYSRAVVASKSGVHIVNPYNFKEEKMDLVSF